MVSANQNSTSQSQTGGTNTVSHEDHMRISSAISTAEKTTSGEIFAVIARSSDDYRYVSGFFSATWALFTGLALAIANWFFQLGLTVEMLCIAQVLSFAASLLVIWKFPTLRMMLVPHKIAHRRAHNNALRQFLAHGIHGTTNRAGVLLFVSLMEHHAEVVADKNINEKVDQQQWDDLVTILTRHAASGNMADGFVMAIEETGKVLAQHFPPGVENNNDLDDRLVEI